MSGILHLSANGHLQQNSMMVFERYYPGQNIMLSRPPMKNDVARIDLPEDIFRWLDYGNRDVWEEVESLCRERHIDKIVLHAAFRRNVNLAAYLKKRIPCKVYWLFWGFELYNALAEDFGVSLVDEKFNPFKIRTYRYPNRVKGLLKYLRYGCTQSDVLRKVSDVADYFCFWNKFDYDLYTKYFGDHVKYKRFGYVCRERNSGEVETYNFPKKVQTILINHQASMTGNHVTLMEKVEKVDKEGKFNICVPLSYGAPYVRKQCLQLGHRMFGDRFMPILDFLPRDEYFDKIDSAQFALFGQKRQEAKGNIGHLLTVCTKVFLR